MRTGCCTRPPLSVAALLPCCSALASASLTLFLCPAVACSAVALIQAASSAMCTDCGCRPRCLPGRRAGLNGLSHRACLCRILWWPCYASMRPSCKSKVSPAFQLVGSLHSYCVATFLGGEGCHLHPAKHISSSGGHKCADAERPKHAARAAAWPSGCNMCTAKHYLLQPTRVCGWCPSCVAQALLHGVAGIVHNRTQHDLQHVKVCLTLPCPRCLQGNCRWLTWCAPCGRWPTRMPTLPTTFGCWCSPLCGPRSAKRRSSRCICNIQLTMWFPFIFPQLLKHTSACFSTPHSAIPVSTCLLLLE